MRTEWGHEGCKCQVLAVVMDFVSFFNLATNNYQWCCKLLAALVFFICFCVISIIIIADLQTTWCKQNCT
jgi:hypothetical protein